MSSAASQLCPSTRNLSPASVLRAPEPTPLPPLPRAKLPHLKPPILRSCAPVVFDIIRETIAAGALPASENILYYLMTSGVDLGSGATYCGWHESVKVRGHTSPTPRHARFPRRYASADIPETTMTTCTSTLSSPNPQSQDQSASPRFMTNYSLNLNYAHGYNFLNTRFGNGTTQTSGLPGCSLFYWKDAPGLSSWWTRLGRGWARDPTTAPQWVADQGLLSVVAHELAEHATDPDPW